MSGLLKRRQDEKVAFVLRSFCRSSSSRFTVHNKLLFVLHCSLRLRSLHPLLLFHKLPSVPILFKLWAQKTSQVAQSFIGMSEIHHGPTVKDLKINITEQLSSGSISMTSFLKIIATKFLSTYKESFYSLSCMIERLIW